MTRASKGKRGYNSREVATREIKQTFLIVCEGSKTEPNYFRGFRFPGLVIEIVAGEEDAAPK